MKRTIDQTGNKKATKSFFISDILDENAPASKVKCVPTTEENKENIPPGYIGNWGRPSIYQQGKLEYLLRREGTNNLARHTNRYSRAAPIESSYLCKNDQITRDCPIKTECQLHNRAKQVSQGCCGLKSSSDFFGNRNNKSTTALPSSHKQEVKGLKRWECHQCDRFFDRPSLLTRHSRIHTGERPFTCNICNKMFSSSSSLNTHSRIHTGEKPHVCEICGKCFTASSNLYYHRMTHFEQKPHQCSFCEKSFPTPGDLRNHLPIHTNVWPLVCPCGRGFVKANPFRNHLLSHLGLPRYECKICLTSFNLLRLLKTHLCEAHSFTALECSNYWKSYLSEDGRSECKRLVELVRRNYNSRGK